MFWTFLLNLPECRMRKLERWVVLFYPILPVMPLIAAHFLYFLEVGGNPGLGRLATWDKFCCSWVNLTFIDFPLDLILHQEGDLATKLQWTYYYWFPIFYCSPKSTIQNILWPSFLLWDNTLELLRVFVWQVCVCVWRWLSDHRHPSFLKCLNLSPI